MKLLIPHEVNGQAPVLLALADGSLLAAWEREKRVFVALVPR